jgi:hypothetical protein
LYYNDRNTLDEAISILNHLEDNILDNGTAGSMWNDHGVWLLPDTNDYSSQGLLIGRDTIRLCRAYKADNPQIIPPLIELFQCTSVELKYAAERYIVSFGKLALPYLRAACINKRLPVREEVPELIEKIQNPSYRTLNQRKVMYMRRKYQH